MVFPSGDHRASCPARVRPSIAVPCRAVIVVVISGRWYLAAQQVRDGGCCTTVGHTEDSDIDDPHRPRDDTE